MYKKQIEEYFNLHKDEMLEDICKVIRIKSDRQEPKEGMPFGEGVVKVLKEALDIASNMGFATNNYDNYVGTVDFNDKEKALDILAHLDVVPAGDEWTVTEPYEPIIKDGKLYGRGSADDKGPAIVALYALKAVKDLNIPLNKNVRLILGTDEECGSSDIEYYYKIEKEAPMTFSPDADFPVINVEKGGLKANFIADFKEDRTLPRIISVNSGVKVNVIPDKATAVIEGIEKNEVEKYCDTVTNKIGVKFTVNEENNKLYVTLLDNLPKENMVVNYGASPYPTNYDLDRTIEGIITLKDRDGNISKGKLAEGTDLLTDNRYCIDITNLKKPFTLEIPSISIVIPEGLNSSDIVELPIPTNEDKININKNIMINNKDEMFIKANSHVNIVSIQRDGEYYTIELNYPDNEDREVKMLECVVVPAGNSITTEGENWFEDGLSGNISKDGNRTITFKLPALNDDKLFIKVLGSEYEIKGPWKISID